MLTVFEIRAVVLQPHFTEPEGLTCAVYLVLAVNPSTNATVVVGDRKSEEIRQVCVRWFVPQPPTVCLLFPVAVFSRISCGNVKFILLGLGVIFPDRQFDKDRHVHGCGAVRTAGMRCIVE